ncbi:hypothetical protein ACFY7C_13140 [Streptomyces sp. NPDC012769]|uniref:hypothetical protein n=1 Tax=Streptomyces sp. NPDC012769 TaxID=3364848 RepID=UPI0036B6A3D1
MSWDAVALFLLALFGCVTLVLAQVGDVLDRLPRLIRAWREVRRELREGPGGSGTQSEEQVND